MLAPHVFTLGRFLWWWGLTAVGIIPVGETGDCLRSKIPRLIIMLDDLKIPQDSNLSILIYSNLLAQVD